MYLKNLISKLFRNPIPCVTLCFKTGLETLLHFVPRNIYSLCQANHVQDFLTPYIYFENEVHTQFLRGCHGVHMKKEKKNPHHSVTLGLLAFCISRTNL